MTRKPTRKGIIGKLKTNASRLGDVGKRGVKLTWERAELFVALQGTFAQGKGEHAAFLATAATAARCDESVVKEGVEAYETLSGLTKGNRAKVMSAGWSVSAVRGGLKGLESTDQTKVIAKAIAKGTTNTKVIRDIRKVVAPTNRTRQNETDRNLKLAEKIQSDYDRLVESYGENALLAIIAGAQLAQDNPGQNVAAALQFLAAQVTKATPVVAA
jgi:hypothetical protein